MLYGVTYFVDLEKKTANIRRMPNEFFMFAMKGAPADHDTQTYGLCLTLNYTLISHVFHGK